MASQIKENLAESLTRLLEKKPLSKITVHDITEDCGITRQAFYRYFHTRDDLLRWIYDKNLASVYVDNQSMMWDEIALRMLERVQENKALYRRMVRQSDDYTLEEIMEEYTTELYDRIIYYTTGKEPDGEMKLLLQIYSRGGISMAIRWVRAEFKKSPEEMRDLFRAAMPPKVAVALTTTPLPLAELQKLVKREN